MEEKTKIEDKNEIRTKNENNLFQSENKTKIQIVNTNCSVCNSGCLDEIHDLRKTYGLVQLAEIINKKYDLTLNKDSLSRHFQHYAKTMRARGAVQLYENFSREQETLFEHQNRTLYLINISFKHITERIESGTLDLGLEDFERMVNLYYKTLKDPNNSADDGILAIFQKASKKYGCTLEQGVLVKMPKAND